MLLPAYIFGLGMPELIVILAIVLIIFGPKKLPEIGKALGSTVRELRKSSKEDDSEAGKDEGKVQTEAKAESDSAQKEDAQATS